MLPENKNVVIHGRASAASLSEQRRVNTRDRTRWYPTVLYGQKSAYPCGESAYLRAYEYD
jgi:hypothetical protein